MAENLKVAVVLIRHLNKYGGNQAIYRGGGSIGIIGAVRTAFLVAKDPNDPNRRVMAGVKSNIGKIPESLSFHIEGDDGAAKIVWDEASEFSADDLLAVPKSNNTEVDSALSDAKDFLTDLLSVAPVSAKQVQKDAKECGISKGTLDRAKTELGIKPYKPEFSGPWVWILPSPGNDHLEILQNDADGLYKKESHTEYNLS